MQLLKHKLRLKSQSKRINWKKGSAELIGFALVLPVLCALIMISLGIIQTGVMRQSIEYATYMSARSAVTCDTYSKAQEQAKSTAIANLSSSAKTADQAKVTVTLVGGTSSTTGSGITWEKGALAKVTITLPFKSIIDLKEHTMTSTMYMMVERPAKTYT